MQYSHSRLECFENCPYLYKLRYGDRLETLPSDDPANPLYLGTALHEGIEKGVGKGVKTYFGAYPIISDLHVNEALKLEHWIPKVRNLVFDLCGDNEPIFEKPLVHSDMIGFIDLLVPVGDGVFDLYDFKYSNSVDRYAESRQLHEYKWFFEQSNPTKRIRNLGFIFIPKTSIRQKKTEDLAQFRTRLKETLDGLEIKTLMIDYNPEKVIDFYRLIKKVNETKEFTKNETRFCDFCEFKDFCKEGENYMLLPKNERRQVNIADRKKVWIYGAPFSGKTTLADHFPNPIMLNTDGNLNSFTAPVVEIKETLEGRIKVSAWENLKDTIDELQKGSDFETIVVDLVEDCYEHCRRWCYAKLGIEHESDNSFKAWDFVRNEFLTTFKKLMTLDYNIVLISHEDSSKDITKKTGDKITSIRPNIQDKVANKLAGMVDIVARVVADGDERTLQFKSDDVVFGGGRLKLLHTVVPLDYRHVEEVYLEAGGMSKSEAKRVAVQTVENPDPKPEETPTEIEEVPDPVENEEEETPRRRRGRPRKVEEEKPAEEAPWEDEAPEQPVRRRRRRVAEE